MAKTILVVDDKASFRRPIEARLRANGFEVRTAANGVEALSSIESEPPDLVLLDLRMPIMDGLSTLRVMRERAASRSIPVIVLSAAGDRARVAKAARFGIASYLLKATFSVQELLQRVDSALRSSGVSASDYSAASPSAPSHGKLSASLGPPTLDERALAAEAPRPAPVGVPASSPKDHSTGLGRTGGEKPLLTRKEVLERVAKIGEITAFAPTVSHLMKITADQGCSMSDVADAVSRDPVVALKILKLANSSLYGRGDRAKTVHQAVRRIGLLGTRQAVMNIGVIERFDAPVFSDHLSTAQFWEHSIACGIIAWELAVASGDRDAETAFTCGLLHDLGRIILAQALGEMYFTVLDAARHTDSPLELVESRMLTLTHADIMDSILRSWNVPKQVADPIRFHHTEREKVEKASPECALPTLRLGLADRLAHALLLGNSGNDVIYPTEARCRALNVKADTLSHIESTARRKTDEARLALLATSDGQIWTRRSDEIKKSLPVPVWTLFASAAPEFDAYRMLCDQLSDPSVAVAPNIAVAHIAAREESAGVLEQLAALERGAGVSQLPTLVLTPESGREPNRARESGRQILSLPIPTSTTRLVSAITELSVLGTSRKAA